MDDTKDRSSMTRREVLGVGGALGAALVGSALGASSAAAQAPPKEAELPQVPRRVLGKTGQSIPILLVGGAVKLDPRFDPKLAEALRFGVNYFDAADCYGGGSCEPAVGSFHVKANARDKVWITSKSDEHEPAGFEKTLAASLEKLKTDHVDMYFLHALTNGDYLSAEMAKLVERLKKEGKIRYFGFSCHDGNVAELLQRAAATSWVDAVMFRYNFRQYGDKELNAAMDACAKANVGLIAMKTQGSEASFTDAWKKFESTGKWTKHQAVLKAVWADPRITAAVSHMDNLEKLKQNVAAALDKAELSALDRDAIERYAADTRHMACSGCDHLCNPAVGAPVKIGTTLRYLMYHDVYGEQEKARRLFGELPEAVRNIKGVDFQGAESACPHGVAVASLMERASQVLA